MTPAGPLGPRRGGVFGPLAAGLLLGTWSTGTGVTVAYAVDAALFGISFWATWKLPPVPPVPPLPASPSPPDGPIRAGGGDSVTAAARPGPRARPQRIKRAPSGPPMASPAWRGAASSWFVAPQPPGDFVGANKTFGPLTTVDHRDT